MKIAAKIAGGGMFGQKHDEDTGKDIDMVAAQPPVSDDSASSHAQSDWQHPGAPLSSSTPSDVTTPVQDNHPAQEDSTDESQHHEPMVSSPDSPARHTDDLIDIKQKALNQLSPLVKHLDQSPEDKFKTTMMMIQASDDQSLVAVAYEAAQQIQDEKTKAQALLDIVNEINYFTQHSTN